MGIAVALVGFNTLNMFFVELCVFISVRVFREATCVGLLVEVPKDGQQEYWSTAVSPVAPLSLFLLRLHPRRPCKAQKKVP